MPAILGFLRSVSARKLGGFVLLALGAEQLYRAGLFQRHSQQPIVGTLLRGAEQLYRDGLGFQRRSQQPAVQHSLVLAGAPQTAEASWSLVNQHQGATSSAATTHMHSAPVVFGGSSTGVTSLYNNPSTAVAFLDHHKIFTSPSSTRTDDGLHPAFPTSTEPLPQILDDHIRVDQEWVVVEADVYFGLDAVVRLDVRMQGRTRSEHPSGELLSVRLKLNVNTGETHDESYMLYQQGRELPPRRKAGPLPPLPVGPSAPGGSSTAGTGAAGSTEVAVVCNFAAISDAEFLHLHCPAPVGSTDGVDSCAPTPSDSPAFRLPGSPPYAFPAAHGWCGAHHYLLRLNSSSTVIEDSSRMSGSTLRQQMEQLTKVAASVINGLRFWCWPALKCLASWAINPSTFILVLCMAFMAFMLYEACVDKRRVQRVSDDNVRASNALGRELAVTQEFFALADFAAFINMPNPAFYWQLPVRTWEEVAASRRTNFLGFLQDTSKAAMHRLWSWITTAPKAAMHSLWVWIKTAPKAAMHRLWYCTMIAFAFLYFYSKFLWQASFVLTGLAFVFVTELVMLLVWELPTPGGLRPLPLQLGADRRSRRRSSRPRRRDACGEGPHCMRQRWAALPRGAEGPKAAGFWRAGEPAPGLSQLPWHGGTRCGHS